MSDLINYRLKVSIVDNRNFIGTLLAFDKHMNMVLSDCEETRVPKKALKAVKKEENVTELKRNLGLIILRGDQIVNMTIQSEPLTSLKKRIGLERGSGVSRAIKTPVGKGKFKGFKKA